MARDSKDVSYNTQALHSESSMPALGGNDFGIGSKISNKYILTELLGDGGMGKVYKAKLTIEGRYHKIDKYYAVKLLDIKGRDIQEQDLIRFERECRLLASLEHENIVKLHEYNPIEQYLIMEYLEGETLDKIISRTSSIELNELKSIASQICKGLDYVHSKGIIHRDLKPSNIFICKKEDQIVVKIIDFGVARQATDLSATVVGSLVGTRPYASPEQRIGIDVQKTSDIYTLGIILYEMLTGKRLNSETREMPSLRRDKPEYQDKAIPRYLCLLIKKMLSVNPKDRPSSTAEVLEYIESIYRTNSEVLSSLIESGNIKSYDAKTIVKLISDKFIEIKTNNIPHRKITSNDIFLYSINQSIFIEVEPIIELKLGVNGTGEDSLESEIAEIVDIRCLGKIIYEVVTADKLRTGEEVLVNKTIPEKYHRRLLSLSEEILSRNSYKSLEDVHRDIMYICNDDVSDVSLNLKILKDTADNVNIKNARFILLPIVLFMFTVTTLIVIHFVYKSSENSSKDTVIQPSTPQSLEQPYPDNFIAIEGGEYTVGFYYDEKEKKVRPDKKYIDEFAISKYEVRNSEYVEFISDENEKTAFFQRIRDLYNLSKSVDRKQILINYGDYPVVGITEEEANAYCKWMNDKRSDKNLVYYLPSYYEWNAAAYGSRTTPPEFETERLVKIGKRIEIRRVDDKENDENQRKVIAMLSNVCEIVAWSDKEREKDLEDKEGEPCLVVRGIPKVEILKLSVYKSTPWRQRTGFRIAVKRK